MFDQSIKRVGFACKFQDEHGDNIPGTKTSTTTLTWLNRQTKDVAVERLWLLMKQNIAAISAQVDHIAKLPPNQRMFRITSDVLAAYTHTDWMWFYFQFDVESYLECELMKIGDKLRKHDIKCSFHPGQFCVLASENDNIVENSITEFEYHADLIRYMGFGKTFQDFKCNVHISGKRGPEGIIAALKRLTPEARNTLTIENAEFTWGIDSSLELVDHCALVLDIHHHWIHTGTYFDPSDPKVNQIIDSWRGVRPTIHYSQSREDLLVDHDPLVAPDFESLRAQGFTKAKLRAHSEMYWNHAQNLWAREFLSWADIMCEAKQKNYASQKFAKIAFEI